MLGYARIEHRAMNEAPVAALTQTYANYVAVGAREAGRMEYVLDTHMDPETAQAAIRRGIRAADPTDVGARDWQPVAIVLRDPDAVVIAGLYGATMWSWLMIDGLWVKSDL